MNYLAHLFLSPANTEIKVGNLMGDFVKGKQFPTLSKSIVQGIYLHRAIDKFTDNHHDVRALKECLSIERKRFHGVIADIAFDHFLALHWERYASMSLEAFTAQSYKELLAHHDLMPQRMQMTVSRMVEGDWLPKYKHKQALINAIDGVSRRIRFENKLLGGGEEVLQYYDDYQACFERFFPQLCHFVEHYSFDE